MAVKIDKLNMRKIILDFPDQFRVGLGAAKRVEVEGKFDRVLICGMGGSALPRDILRMWLEAYQIGFPLSIHRNYGLPYQVDERDLIICISYSGNTEETLTAYQEALRKKLSVVSITSGGKLAELCKKNKTPWAEIPTGLPARLALGYQFAALMKILVNSGLIRNNLENILALEKSLQPKNLETQGKKLAKKLKNKIPLIYASEQRKPLAYIWKFNFNENSKIHAFCNYFPKLNHDELTGWTHPQKKFYVIILRDPADHPKILKRMQLTSETIKSKKINVDFIDIRGQDILFKIFSNILLSSWVSYYLALEYGIDPVLMKLVEEFKKKMRK